MTVRAFDPMRSKKSSTASTPTGRSRASDRIPGSGCPSRGRSSRRMAVESVAMVGLAVDLAADDGARLPDPAAATTNITGITLPRLALAPGIEPFRVVLAALRAAEGRAKPAVATDLAAARQSL